MALARALACRGGRQCQSKPKPPGQQRVSVLGKNRFDCFSTAVRKRLLRTPTAVRSSRWQPGEAGGGRQAKDALVWHPSAA